MNPMELLVVLLVLGVPLTVIVLCRRFGIFGIWWNSGHPSLLKKRPCSNCGTWSWIMRSRCPRCDSLFLFEHVVQPLSPPKEGRLPKHLWSSILLAVLWPLAPIALILAIIGLRDTISRGRNKALSVFCITWTSLFALLFLLMVTGVIPS